MVIETARLMNCDIQKAAREQTTEQAAALQSDREGGPCSEARRSQRKEDVLQSKRRTKTEQMY